MGKNATSLEAELRAWLWFAAPASRPCGPPIAARARLPHPCWRPAGFLVGGSPSARCGLQASTALTPRPDRREGAAPTPLLAACWLSCGRVALGPMRPSSKHSPYTKARSPRGRGSHTPAGGLLALLWEGRPRPDAAFKQAQPLRQGPIAARARLPHPCWRPAGFLVGGSPSARCCFQSSAPSLRGCGSNKISG
jgi:hypothetical protein